MPTYDYRCPKCGTGFEVFQRMKDKPKAKCPKCGAKAERQMSGGHGLVFKGSGFYTTDYKRAGEQKDGPEQKEKTEGKGGGSGSSGSSSGSTSSGSTG